MYDRLKGAGRMQNRLKTAKVITIIEGILWGLWVLEVLFFLGLLWLQNNSIPGLNTWDEALVGAMAMLGMAFEIIAELFLVVARWVLALVGFILCMKLVKQGEQKAKILLVLNAIVLGLGGVILTVAIVVGTIGALIGMTFTF